MISVSGKKWIETKVDKNLVEKIKQDFNYSEILSRLIISRKFDLSEINNIDNDLKVSNIFKNNEDFNNATDLVVDCIKKNENICILGDYDVDGSAATSLLVRFFNHINQPHFYYIPDRVSDGYGASKKLFQKLILKKPKLMILVDCGSTSNEAIEFLNQNNIKSIIIDHHEINKPYPKSNTVINPKKNNGYLKYDYLCATALTYFFLEILIRKVNSNFKITDFLLYVLLATICDVMPLRKINKIIASNALTNLNKIKHLAFESIFEISGTFKSLETNDLGYLIGPIINAGGRLGYSTLGVELLASNNLNIIKKKSNKLIELNNKRKIIEEKILEDIDFKKIEIQNKNVIIYYNPNINEGLIGIIAARLKEHFNKPTIVITSSNNILKASARSTTSYNIGNLIKTLFDKKIILKGGGHNMAAGFTILKDNINLLDNFIQNDYSKKVKNKKIIYEYDAEISSAAINMVLMNEINKLGPFGNYNLLPSFFIKNLRIIKVKVLKDKHVSLILKPSIGASIKAICFNCNNYPIYDYLISYKKKINIIAELKENIWNNKKSVQLNIKDLVLEVN
ncbi:single-stranded-DNA-specific exonuclease RecJ [Candidatus Pelagibacter sp.]|nr:single-stranded-DNA-specific exonuclease RecJ [Candidatus Pelagibacter sp.]